MHKALKRISNLSTLALALAALALTGCKGDLKPEEQREYDALTKEREALRAKTGAANAAADKAFREAGAGEQRHKLVQRQVLMCGGSAGGQAFGPFPFQGERRGTLDRKGQPTVSGQKCETYDLRVK